MRAERNGGRMEERKERANAEWTGQCMKEEVEEKVRKGRIYEKEKGKEGEGRRGEGRGRREEGRKGGKRKGRQKTERITLAARAPRVWGLYQLDTEYCGVNPGPGAQEQGQ